MARFRLRAKFQGRGSIFRDTSGKFVDATDGAVVEFLNDRKRDIINNYDDYKSLVSKRAHPLTEVTDNEPDQIHLTLEQTIQIRKEEDGVYSVGWFEQDKQYMAILFLQEFGGNILITDRMRIWYNTMSRKYDFPPLNPETKFMVIPAGMFIRNAFFAAEFGSQRRLSNLLRFAVKSIFGELRADTPEERSLSTIGRLESPTYGGETPPGA